MVTSGDVVLLDGVEVEDGRGAGAPEVGPVCGAVDTGLGAALRDATDRDEVEGVAGRDGPVTAVVVAGVGVCGCVWAIGDVPALAGEAPSAAALFGSMKAKDSNAVSPPIQSRTSEGSGFQLASLPAC